ncbi:hypothetical protein [Bradyrhizobium sp. SZCCHNG3015]|uniref:hypothetical protein n=1 Tax=Bradyrhizobium sp. SZCCHNG3015 TaxID=3057270 RepID=UPI0028EBDF66|nr:hypothetical protein [Bradyrhizobium sp. SZCCHNG3015]
MANATKPETYTLEVEYTDTFGGEANYAWVKRETLELPCGLSDRAVMRRAKAAMGLSGVRGRSYVNGDMWEFRPYRSCTVMFANVRY